MPTPAELTRTEDDFLKDAPPRPWDWQWVGATNGSGHVYLIDANGRKIGVLWGKSKEKEATADLIISLVNNAGHL